jgi:hypothetical protein
MLCINIYNDLSGQTGLEEPNKRHGNPEGLELALLLWLQYYGLNPITTYMYAWETACYLPFGVQATARVQPAFFLLHAEGGVSFSMLFLVQRCGIQSSAARNVPYWLFFSQPYWS